MEGDMPINSMFNLIPEKRMAEFKRFASIFGFTEENINTILKREKHENEKVKYTAKKLAIIRKRYELNRAIDSMMKDLPNHEFEMLRLELMDELDELRSLECSK